MADSAKPNVWRHLSVILDRPTVILAECSRPYNVIPVSIHANWCEILSSDIVDFVAGKLPLYFVP
jgi:hypothetical protein